MIPKNPNFFGEPVCPETPTKWEQNLSVSKPEFSLRDSKASQGSRTQPPTMIPKNSDFSEVGGGRG